MVFPRHLSGDWGWWGRFRQGNPFDELKTKSFSEITRRKPGGGRAEEGERGRGVGGKGAIDMAEEEDENEGKVVGVRMGGRKDGEINK